MGKKKFGAAVGVEILFLLLAELIAYGAGYLQMLGRIEIRELNRVMFSGIEYQYNYFMYLFGIMIYFGCTSIVYFKFLRTRIAISLEHKMPRIIVYSLISILLSFGIFAALRVENFFVLGFGDEIRPQGLLHVTTYGWPIMTAALMIADFILLFRKNSFIERKE